MKNLLKVRSIVAINMVTAIAILAFAGCTGSDGKSEKESTASSPTSSVVEEKSVEESSENVVESKEDSDVVSEVGTSEIESEVESIQESILNSSNVGDSSEESSSVSIEDAICYGKTVGFSSIIYKLSSSNEISGMVSFSEDHYFAIISTTDDEVYQVLYKGDIYFISKNSIELLPEDYTPDFNDYHWTKGKNY